MATGITGLFSAGDLASAENQSMRDRAMERAKLSVGDAGAYTAGLGSGMLVEGLAGMAGMKTRNQKKQEVSLDLYFLKMLYVLLQEYL